MLFDSFILSGRDIQILGPKHLRDLIPYLSPLTSDTFSQGVTGHLARSH